ncbi:uncharacterized protein BXZ73DRAFT_78799 [Epithele typhae]|uniref:uncharacterized protein n=1 Tax=Epithele typhae TaxID=378194 RepID=UPI002008A536|nr:uncharacterized protein BXZ73DRAFT_78799 [Epithele typhae]KAH9926295.1 hypothetical protein BXZ73DRAFT_78799 [Epithele typhae]
MSHTAWTSDRLAPKSSTPPPRNKPKQQQQQQGGKQSGPPKSAEVKKLESREAARRAAETRVRPLSQHTPICRSCALVLYKSTSPIHISHYTTTLLSDAARPPRIDDTPPRRRQSASALSRGASSPRRVPYPRPVLALRHSHSPAHLANQTHKVLSLDSKTHKVKVATYTPPSMSRTASLEKVAKAAEPEYTRVPAPSPEVVVARAPPKDRPRANMRGPNVTYMPPTRVV